MKTSILDIFKWGLIIFIVYCLCFVVGKTIWFSYDIFFPKVAVANTFYVPDVWTMTKDELRWYCSSGNDRIYSYCPHCEWNLALDYPAELAKQSEVIRIELERIRDEIARLKEEKTKADIERVKQAQQMNTIQCLDMFYTMPELDNKNILDELNREYSGRLKLYFKIAEEQKEMEAK
jgi:predicted  nucleic acid-binding Zn-ribbon protein